MLLHLIFKRIFKLYLLYKFDLQLKDKWCTFTIDASKPSFLFLHLFSLDASIFKIVIEVFRCVVLKLTKLCSSIFVILFFASESFYLSALSKQIPISDLTRLGWGGQFSVFVLFWISHQQVEVLDPSVTKWNCWPALPGVQQRPGPIVNNPKD